MQQSRKHKTTQYPWQQQKLPMKFSTYPTTNKPCSTTMLQQVFPQKKLFLMQYKQELMPHGQA
jgi:hypothetical protein